MANLTSYARPYALAAFEFAREKNNLPAWQAFLSIAMQVANEPRVMALLNNPEIGHEKSFTVFHSVLASLLDDGQKNFLLLLAHNKRLILLPSIAIAYNAHYAAYQKMRLVRVVTAIEVGPDYKQRLANALSKRIDCEVTLECEINPAIIGGAIIHIGDRVIDGSIQGKLTRLLESIAS